MEKLLKRLERPQGSIDVVLDTDTYNEVDDQFALSYLIKCSHKLNLQGIYAAPFFNNRSQNPEDGMEKSFDEINNLLTLMGEERLKSIVFKGSKIYLPSEKEAVDSPAAKHLCSLAMNYTSDKPLYVVAIGAITNVASAILINPEIINRIVIVWLGGHALHWHDNTEFNLAQDVAAARIIFGCGAALVQLPCMGVVSSFTLSGPELEHHLKGKNPLCDYLVNYTSSEAVKDGGNTAWTRIIWDVCAVAWLTGENFMLDRFEPSPIPQYDHHYSIDPRRHFIKYVYHINRDALMEDLFTKLQN